MLRAQRRDISMLSCYLALRIGGLPVTCWQILALGASVYQIVFHCYSLAVVSCVSY